MTVTTLFPSPKEAPQTRFDELWICWPRKEKKPLAKAKYEAILKGLKTRTFDKDSNSYVEIDLQATEDEILAGAKAFITSQIDRNTFKFKDDGKYLPHLATWLNQGRWGDAT